MVVIFSNKFVVGCGWQMSLLFWVLADSGEFMVLVVVVDYGVLVG